MERGNRRSSRSDREPENLPELAAGKSATNRTWKPSGEGAWSNAAGKASPRSLGRLSIFQSPAGAKVDQCGTRITVHVMPLSHQRSSSPPSNDCEQC